MSFEKPVKSAEDQGLRRQDGVEYTCSYCGKPIKTDEPLVHWDMVCVPVSEFEAHLAPIAKLAAQSNPTKWREKYDHYSLDLAWHTHCAVYFGGHLVKDGLSDSRVSKTLRDGSEK